MCVVCVCVFMQKVDYEFVWYGDAGDAPSKRKVADYEMNTDHSVLDNPVAESESGE